MNTPTTHNLELVIMDGLLSEKEFMRSIFRVSTENNTYYKTIETVNHKLLYIAVSPRLQAIEIVHVVNNTPVKRHTIHGNPPTHKELEGLLRVTIRDNFSYPS